MKIADAALVVMREQGEDHCWYGFPDLIADIYERSGGSQDVHPLNRSAAVMGALARSPLFRKMGYIRHLGRRYPVYEIARQEIES